MDDRDMMIQQLAREAAQWKNRALEASGKACANCGEYTEDRRNCGGCRVKRIMEEAAEPGRAWGRK